MKLRLAASLAALCGLIAPSASFGADAEICYSQEPSHVSMMLTADQKLNCPDLGKKNLKELVAIGWSIIDVTFIGNFDPMHRNWMVVLQKK